MKRVIAAMLVMGLAGVVCAQQGGQGRAGGFPGAPNQDPKKIGNYSPELRMRNINEALMELNMLPTFTLSEEQKKVIKAARDEFKAGQDAWLATGELAAAEKAWWAARADKALQEKAGDALKDVYAKQPKAEPFVERIKAVLTAEQMAALKPRLLKEVGEK